MSAGPTIATGPVFHPGISQRVPPRLSRFIAMAAGCLAAGLIGGYLAGHWTGFNEGADRRRELPNGSIHCKPGPWGDVSYTPFTIAAPDDLLPIRTLEAKGVHWFFKGYTADNFVSLLQSTSLTPAQQQALMGPGSFQAQPDGIELSPTADQLLSLPEDARGQLYQVLAQDPENEMYFIREDSMDQRFGGGAVSPDTLALFKLLSFQSGNYVLFSGVSAVLSRLPSYDEKLHFLKALTLQQTMLLRLHVTPDSNIPALTEYWGKGCWGTDVGTIMQSLTTIPTGTWMNILMVLPPLPTQQIYDYPTIVDNPMDGPPVNRDSLWTSLNFFRDEPEPNFGKPVEAMKELRDSYSLAPADARYGDVVLFSKPDGSLVHSAVYIADDICFNKDSGSVTDPWMLSSIQELLERYSFQAPPGQRLSISFFRNKRL